MTFSRKKQQAPRSPRRRGIVVVQVMVLLGVLVGFAALTVDVGQLYSARGDLQRAADSAALAGVSALASDDMIGVRYGSGDIVVVEDTADTRAGTFSALNFTLNDATLVENEDILTGWIDLTSATSPIDSGVPASQYNAVQVTARRSDGANGPVEFFFAPIFGQFTASASATAVAAFDDRFEGFDVGVPGASDTMPFAIHEDIFDADLVGGSDNYGFDLDLGGVQNAADGVREVNIYPNDAGPGNFGLLNIGTPNQGVPALRDQIEDGVDPADMEAEIGTSLATFFDDSGNPVTYSISGDPGMKSALEASVVQRVGDVIAFFLHDGATGTGANLVYNVTTMRFGRLMDVRLNGNPNQQGIWVQPVVYQGGGVALGTAAGSSGGLVGSIVLAR